MIDTSFDFTSDSPGYWDGFWENRGGLGVGSCDPDAVSGTLREYHRGLWSKQLPCGKEMILVPGSGPNYLTWNDYRFASDSILVSFRYERNRSLIEKVSEKVPDYRGFVENYIRRFYTIGGMIIFPKHPNSINQAKGTSRLIGDRWDLTLECIRRYYAGADSPLYDVLNRDRDFFSLFVDFRGYVDFFFLQDCVSADYSRVEIWLGSGDFNESPFPQSADQYLEWIDKEMEFLNKRNSRIAKSQDNESKVKTG